LTGAHVQANLHAVSRQLLIVALALIVFQSTSLRACALEKFALGGNCHDRDNSDPSHSHQSSNHHCVCESPSPTMQRTPKSVNLTDSAWILDVIPSQPQPGLLSLVFTAPIDRDPLDPPDRCCNLPRLN
jgi:hypothetical protein